MNELLKKIDYALRKDSLSDAERVASARQLVSQGLSDHAPAARPCGEEVEPDELADMIADRSSDRAAHLIVKNFSVFRRAAAPPVHSAAEHVAKSEGLRPDYIEMMRAHVDEGGQLSHKNGIDLLAEVERLQEKRS